MNTEQSIVLLCSGEPFVLAFLFVCGFIMEVTRRAIKCVLTGLMGGNVSSGCRAGSGNIYNTPNLEQLTILPRSPLCKLVQPDALCSAVYVVLRRGLLQLCTQTFTLPNKSSLL